MKLFIDTSNKKLILALIDNDNNIIDFSMKDSNNDMVKNTLPNIEKFVKKNSTSLNDIKEYMTTTGPGSFTGVKVSINIIRTINLVNQIDKVHTISTFDLLSTKGKKYTAIGLGKNKYYLRNNLTKSIKTVEEISKPEQTTIEYSDFTKEKLQEKINLKSFKVLDNINKVKINYINKF